ncbi:MAG: hypothetical protein MZV63_64430 [Marinilabiliales bacterium]|nr:hypothetical protein [Marinilabiliales bacterium]
MAARRRTTRPSAATWSRSSGGLMADYSAGHIRTEESRPIVPRASTRRSEPAASALHPGRELPPSDRDRQGLPGGARSARRPTTSRGRTWEPHLPQGPGREAVLELDGAGPAGPGGASGQRETGRGREEAGDRHLALGPGPGADAGHARRADTGSTGSVISAVDLVRGLGVLAGLEVRPVEGATGYLGTNYAGKVAAAKAALEAEDFVYLHVEAPDEMSHEGRADQEDPGHRGVRPASSSARCCAWAEARGDVRVVVATDHETPVAIKTHAGGPMPYAVCGPGSRRARPKRSASRPRRTCPSSPPPPSSTASSANRRDLVFANANSPLRLRRPGPKTVPGLYERDFLPGSVKTWHRKVAGRPIK